jgi:hypothetical protein
MPKPTTIFITSVALLLGFMLGVVSGESSHHNNTSPSEVAGMLG